MFGLGLPELIIILLIVILVFGSKRLAGLGTGLGQAIRGFKKGLSDEDEPDHRNSPPGS